MIITKMIIKMVIISITTIKMIIMMMVIISIIKMMMMMNLSTHQSSRESLRSSEHHLPLLHLDK